MLSLILLLMAGGAVVLSFLLLAPTSSLVTVAAVATIIVGLVKIFQQGVQPITLIMVAGGFALLFMGDVTETLSIGEAASFVTTGGD